jgi:SAM-dependent methyltransferase
MNKALKTSIKRSLITLRLIWLADFVRFLLSSKTSYSRNVRFRSRHPEFIPPPRYIQFEATNSTDWEFFHNSGLQQAKFLTEIFLRNRVQANAAILEWGCGPCRILRHMPKLLPGSYFGLDYNARTVKYSAAAFRDISFSTNALLPPLPFEEETFDGIFCISVFTHLSETSSIQWMHELKRVLKPTGVLIFTTNGVNAMEELSEPERIAFQEIGFVARQRNAEGKKWFTGYHAPALVQSRLLAGFEVLEHIPVAPFDWFPQETWVAKKT